MTAFDPQSLWSFGDRIRKARRAPLKGERMGQKEFAAAIGVKTQVLSNWEAGAALPRQQVRVACQVAKETGYPIWWLLGLNERPQ